METHKLFPGKYFISSILEMLEYKTEMTGQMKRRYLMRAGMAGAIVGLLYIGNYTIQAGFESVGDTGAEPEGLLPIGKLLGSTFFGFFSFFFDPVASPSACPTIELCSSPPDMSSTLPRESERSTRSSRP